MESYTSTVLNQTSMLLSAQNEAQGYMQRFLTPAEGHDHIWIFPHYCDFEASSRGYTQAIVEAMKDLVSMCQSLVNIDLKEKTPTYLPHGSNACKFSFFMGIAFDLEKNKVFYIPIADREEGQVKNFSLSENQQQVIKEANCEELVGQARRVKRGLENYREIQRLKREKEEIRQVRRDIYEQFFHMREQTTPQIEYLEKVTKQQIKSDIPFLKEKIQQLSKKENEEMNEKQQQISKLQEEIEKLEQLSGCTQEQKKVFIQLPSWAIQQIVKESQEEKENLKNLPKQEILEKIEQQQQKRERLLEEMNKLENGTGARMAYVKRNLSKRLKTCMDGSERSYQCDRNEKSKNLVSTQPWDSFGSGRQVHLQCKLVEVRADKEHFIELSHLTNSLDTPLLNFWA